MIIGTMNNLPLKTYLYNRRKEIIADIKTDRIINADNYHNVGLLKEIEKVIKIVNGK